MATEEKKKKSIQSRLNPKPASPNGKEEDPKKKPRLSIYWVYGIMAALIIGYNVMMPEKGAGLEIDNTQFYEMLRLGDVDQIKTVGNKKLVRVTINAQELQADSTGLYKKAFGPAYEDVKKLKTGPQAYFKIIKDEIFATQLASFYKDNPQLKQVPDKPDDEGELFGQIISTLLPILLIALVFIMMMRKVGGGGGAG
ncbi:MAG: hypothetical protein ABIP35_12045, partial [Ginsengibacter sp.]